MRWVCRPEQRTILDSFAGIRLFSLLGSLLLQEGHGRLKLAARHLFQGLDVRPGQETLWVRVCALEQHVNLLDLCLGDELRHTGSIIVPIRSWDVQTGAQRVALGI